MKRRETLDDLLFATWIARGNLIASLPQRVPSLATFPTFGAALQAVGSQSPDVQRRAARWILSAVLHQRIGPSARTRVWRAAKRANGSCAAWCHLSNATALLHRIAGGPRIARKVAVLCGKGAP